VVKVLVDLQAVTGVQTAVDLRTMIDRAFAGYAGVLTPDTDAWVAALDEFVAERELHLFERRGFKADEGRAVKGAWRQPASAFKRVEALAHARKSAEFEALAVLFKRVKNITREFDGELTAEARARLTEPAEVDLLRALDARLPAIEAAVAAGRYADAMRELGALSKPVDRFFVDVLVMAEDPAIRSARLALLSALRRTILTIADIAEIAPDEAKQA
jgi:glycyl-tRNA synthetase beta chain